MPRQNSDTSTGAVERLKIDIVARAIHNADPAHRCEPYHSCAEHYRNMAEAAIAALHDAAEVAA